MTGYRHAAAFAIRAHGRSSRDVATRPPSSTNRSAPLGGKGAIRAVRSVSVRGLVSRPQEVQMPGDCLFFIGTLSYSV